MSIRGTERLYWYPSATHGCTHRTPWWHQYTVL